MPNWLQALILGIVQGVTEFIPVSSSGHLVLVPSLFGWDRPGLAFDVALHVGTLVALLVYYRRDLGSMAMAVVQRGDAPQQQMYRRLAWLLVLGSVPVAIVGLLFRDSVELAFEHPQLAASLLYITAAILLTGELLRRRRVRRATSSNAKLTAGGAGSVDPETGADPEDPTGVTMPAIRWHHAILVGCGQALAVLPGISRSGSTITAGMAAGLTRTAATRFAFLLGIPAIAGATLVSLPDMADLGHYSYADLAVGMAASAVAGYVAIATLVRLVARTGLHRFVIYLVAVATFGVLFFR